MPDNSKDSHGQAMGKLAGFGTALGAFHQGTYQNLGVRATPQGGLTHSGVGGRSLGAGYCVGVCVDWIRRVLLSAANRDPSFLTYHYEKLFEGKGVAKRTAEQLSERAYQSVGMMAQAWYRDNDRPWTYYLGEDTGWIEQEHFDEMVSLLDTQFDLNRAAVRRSNTKKHFSDLVLLASRHQVYPNARLWMIDLLNATRPGVCVQLNFNGSPTEGHAVVFWQRLAELEAPNAFYFFDPNFGAFAYSRRGLAQAVGYLFWQDRNTIPYYDKCASADAQIFSYVVYGPPNLVQATPQPQPQPTAQVVPQTTPQTVQRPRAFGQSRPAQTNAPTPRRPPNRPRAKAVGEGAGVRALIDRFNQNG